MTDFKTALKALTEAGVDFVLIGGYAAMVHGASPGNADLDICYESTQKNRERLIHALSPYHPQPRGIPEDDSFVLDNHLLQEKMELKLDTDLGPVDVFGSFGDEDIFPDLRRKATNISVFGVSIRVASLDDLIRLKGAAGRPKDLKVLNELEHLRKVRDSKRPSTG